MPRSALWGRVESFWLRPIPNARFALVRTVLGLTVMLWGITLGLDLLRIFGDKGFADGLPFNRSQILVLFRFVDGTAVVLVAFLLLLMGSFALMVGRFTRVALPVVALLLITFTTVVPGIQPVPSGRSITIRTSRGTMRVPN